MEIQDTSVGPAYEVSAVDSASFYWWDLAKQSTFFLATFGAAFGALVAFLIERRTKLNLLKNNLPKFTAVFDPGKCGWAEASRAGIAAMQVFATASLATTGDQPTETVQAYLEGAKPAANLMPFIVVPLGAAVVETIHFFIVPPIIQPGKTYRGRIVLVEKNGKIYKSEILDIPYRAHSR